MVNVAYATAALAAELGEDWHVEPGHLVNGSDAYLQGPDDIRIRVSTDHHKKRGHKRFFLSEAVNGGLGKFVRDGLVISVSQDREIMDIAADIRRRLLPVVKEAIRQARIDKADSDARDAEHASTRDALAKVLDGQTYKHDQNNVHFGSYGHGVSGSVQVHKFEGDVKFEVRVPKVLAPAMADTVAVLSKSKVPQTIEPTHGAKAILEPQQSATKTQQLRGRRPPLTPEERQERVEALNERLQAAIDELADEGRWSELLQAAQGFGTTWSFNNIMLIILQAAERGFTASMVKTFKAWRELDRKVKTGEKALYIFEPIKYRLSMEEAQKEGKAGFGSDGKPRMVIRGARPSPRFDISQTEGAPVLANSAAASLLLDEDITPAWEAIGSQIRAAGYTLVGGPPGISDSYTDPVSGEVWVCDTLDDMAAMMAAIQELAHILLNHLDDVEEYRRHRGQMDAESKSVAFIVAGALGMETATSSAVPCVTSWWDGDAGRLADIAERVTRTAQQIIRAFQESTSID